jgi:CRP/FNR family cyclic AMP-dependent transcriptional regulator
MEEFLSLARRHVFKPGSTIIFAGEKSDSIFYITRGTVTVSIEDDTGREIIVAYLSEGQFVGEMAMFGEGTRTAWIKAKTECEVAELSNQRFTELSERKPGVMYALASQLADRLKNTTQKVGDLAFLDVTGRIAGALLELCDEPDAMTHPDGMQIKITRQELGRLVGCSREMAGRVLKALEYQGLVSVKGTTIVVFGTR